MTDYLRCNCHILVGLALAIWAGRCEAIDQFVSNGAAIDGWDEHADDSAGNGPLQQSYHFSKKNPGDQFWQQKLVRRYKKDPNNVYFYDPITRVWIGRYEIDKGKYSRLEFGDRRRNLMHVSKSAFPPATDNPGLHQLSRVPCEPLGPTNGPTLEDIVPPEFKTGD